MGNISNLDEWKQKKCTHRWVKVGGEELPHQRRCVKCAVLGYMPEDPQGHPIPYADQEKAEEQRERALWLEDVRERQTMLAMDYDRGIRQADGWAMPSWVDIRDQDEWID